MIVYPVVDRVTAQLLSANARSLLALSACFEYATPKLRVRAR
jgi:hypothetical protein